MILYDFSSAFHRSLHTAIKHTSPHKKDGKYITQEFISVLIWRIVSEYIEFYNKYNKEYGNFVICLDDHSKPYWRKAIYPEYKAQRKAERDASDVNYGEVFKHIDNLSLVLKNFTCFKVIGVPGVEADDIIGLLTKKYAKFEKVLILSPDKDFKQLHSLGQIRQYSSLTNKWIEPENIEEWKQEHICLGDSVDNVPRIIDFVEFTNEFKTFTENKFTELQFFDMDYEIKSKIIENFKSKYPENDVYTKIRFGPTGLKKAIQTHGSLEAFLDSNPIIRKTYEMNKRLVIDDEIPAKVEAQILAEYVESPKQIDINSLKKYFDFYGLDTCTQLFKELSFKTYKPVEWESHKVDFNSIV